MNSLTKCMLCLLTAIAVGVTLISCGKDKSTDNSMSMEPIKRIAATVNGVPVSMNDLVEEMNAVAPQYIKPGETRDPGIDEKVRKEALERMIYRELAVQAAKREGMKAPAGAVEEGMKNIKAEMKTKDAFLANLRKSGITEEELKMRIERNILVDMITEKEIFERVKMDSDEPRKVFAKRKKSFKGPSGQMTFEEARPLIEKELMTAAVRKREDEWVAELKKAARIEIAP